MQYTVCSMYQCVWTFARFSPTPVGVFSRSRLRGTQEARLYTTEQVWVPYGLRGVCSGRSKSRNLVRNYEVAFRGARAEHNRKPTYQLFCSTAPLLLKPSNSVAATVQQQSHMKFVWTTTMCVWTLHLRVCYVL